MASMKAGAVLAALLAAGFSVAACSATLTPTSSISSGTGTGSASGARSLSLMYQTLQDNYLMQISFPSAGGPVNGTVTVGLPCTQSDGSAGVYRYGPFQISGTYYPHGDSAGDEFEFSRSTGGIAGANQQSVGDTTGSSQEVIGDLGGSIFAVSDGQGGLLINSAQDWAPDSESGFNTLVEHMWGLGLPHCNS